MTLQTQELEIKECTRIKQSSNEIVTDHKSSELKCNGLFAKRSWKKDDIVFVLHGDISDTPSKYSIHIGDNLHIIDKYGSFMNHSFDPNARVNKINIVAIKDINIGDEITFDYNSTELQMACPFYTTDGRYVSGSTK
jgi:SET domain-containing protein